VTNSRILALLLAVGLVTLGCARSVDNPAAEATTTGNAVTEQQATRQVQANIHAAAAQLPPTAQLEQQLTDSVPCGDPTDPVRGGLVTAGSTYQVHNVDPKQYPQVFDHLRTWWKAHDFRILDNKHLSTSAMFLSMESNDDGFEMVLQSNDVGGLYLIGSSPCVPPSVTPTPTY
jgi:hypothetical protein